MVQDRKKSAFLLYKEWEIEKSNETKEFYKIRFLFV